MIVGTITPEQLGAYTTAFVFACMAGYERFINRKKAKKTEAEEQQISEAKMYRERGDLMLKQAEEYKVLLEKEYIAHQATRDFHHNQATVSQQKLGECNERCQELQSKTDLSRIEEILIRQMQSMSQIADGIKELLTRR